MKRNIFILLIVASILIVFSTLIFASETIDLKDYIKGKFPVIFNIYLASLGELDEYEKEFIELLQNLPEEEQKNFAKEVYNNGFSKEILEKIKEEIIIPTASATSIPTATLTNTPTLTPLPTMTRSGTLDTDETWSGIVQVTGNIIVPQGVTLTIEPGTIIRFVHNREDESSLTLDNYFDWPKLALYVYGTLKSIGSPENLIIFTSDAPEPRGADWRGIIISTKSSNPDNKSIVKYTIIEYAHKSIMFRGGQGSLFHLVENSILRFANQTFIAIQGSVELEGGSGITYWDGSSPIVRGNIIYGNTFALEVGSKGTPIFENNILCFNQKQGNYYGGANGVRTWDTESSPVFRNNLICGNWWGMEFNWGSKAVVENNIIIWNDVGLVVCQGDPGETESFPNASFNNVWGNGIDYLHDIHGNWQPVPAERFGKGNVSIDPLFTEEDFYNANFEFTQLGMKDSGNPNLFDEDGSRSDIGPNWDWSWVSSSLLVPPR